MSDLISCDEYLELSFGTLLWASGIGYCCLQIFFPPKTKQPSVISLVGLSMVVLVAALSSDMTSILVYSSTEAY